VAGAGFTGLGVARRRAMAGKSVAVSEAVSEAVSVGAAASGHNSGRLNNGNSYPAAIDLFGPPKARERHHAFDGGHRHDRTHHRLVSSQFPSCPS
jgi:glycine/D-amino acid oxidase-like deaminating enzyme